MRIFGLMVVKNEADRYFSECLEWHRDLVDGLVVMDDGSTDNTFCIAAEAGCYVVSRPEGVPSFLEHEGKCRAAAWNLLERTMSPSEEDWILALDADEFLVSESNLTETLRRNCLVAEFFKKTSVTIDIPEVFDLDGPKIRKDGWWGQTTARRLFRYRQNGSFKDQAMGGGSGPTYVAAEPSMISRTLHLLHYGYARQADREAKYARYTGQKRHGHSDLHIQSILQSPVLVPWEGPTPSIALTDESKQRGESA